MKTIKFEDALKDYLEEMKRTGWYTKAYKAFVEANILKLVMERRPVADPNATMDLFDATEMTEIVREAEGDDRGLHEVRDRTDGSRVLSPPEASADPIVHKAGDIRLETSGTAHWWRTSATRPSFYSWVTSFTIRATTICDAISPVT